MDKQDEILLGLPYTPLVWITVVLGVGSILFFIYAIIRHTSDMSLSWRNVLRNKRRTILTLSAVVFAFSGNALLGNYFLDMFLGLRETTIRSQTGHMQILKKDFLKYGGSRPAEYLIENPDKILEAIYADKELKSLIKTDMKEIRFNGIVGTYGSGSSLTFLGRGVDLESDALLSTFDVYVEGGAMNANTTTQVVLGQGLAEQLRVNAGDSVTLLGSTADGGLNVLDGDVQGVIETFSREYSNVVLKTSLAYAREMLGTDGVNKLVFLLKKTVDTEAATERMKDIVRAHPDWEVEVYDWQELSDFYVKVHTLFANVFIIVSSLLFGLVIFLVVNTMTMSIYERFSEFGTLRSIGLKKRKLIMLILLEGILLGIVGSLLGIVFTWGVGELVGFLDVEVPAPPGQTKGYPLSLEIQFTEWAYVQLLIMSLFSVIGVTVLSVIIPSARATKLKIIDALRHT